MHGTAETIRALAIAKNPYRLIMLFVLLLRRCLLDYQTQTEISGRAKGHAKRFMLILSAQLELIHSITSARSNGWAECRDKKVSASSRRGRMSLDIPSLIGL